MFRIVDYRGKRVTPITFATYEEASNWIFANRTATVWAKKWFVDVT